MRRRRRFNWEHAGVLLAAVWLVSMYFPVRALLDTSPWPRTIGFVLLALFIVVYLEGFRTIGPFLPTSKRPRRLATLGLLIACTGAMALIIGNAALTLAIFLIAYAVFALWRPLSFIVCVITIATIVVALVAQGMITSEPGVVTSAFVIFVGGTVTVAMIEGSARAEGLERENLVIAERDKMARDVHDLIGHSLTVVNLKAQLAERLVDTDPARAKTELAEIQSIVSEALGGVRRTVTQARSTTIADELVTAGDALASGGVGVEVIGDPASIKATIGLVGGWVVREATTNVLRHAHASRCRFTFTPTSITVEDDGDGTSGREGNGIRGMRERIAAAGGALSVGASELGGTKVEVTW